MDARFSGQNIVFNLFRQINQRFEQPIAQDCIKLIINEMGGLRITIPSWKVLQRQDRDLKIRNLFNGKNIQELALRFDLSETQIRRIVNKG